MPSVKLTLKADFKGASDEMQKALLATDKHVTKLKADLDKIKTKKFDELVSKSKLLGAAATATRGPLQGAMMAQRNLTREMEKAIRQGIDPQSSKLKALRDEFTRVSQNILRMKEAEKRATEQKRALTKATREQAAAMRAATNAAVRYAKIGIIALATSFTLLAGSMLHASTIIEDAQAAFRPMLRSLIKAEALVDMINETAAKTPFQFEAISMSVKQLLPAVKGNMGEVIKTFRMLGDVSSGNAQRLDSVTRAFTKSMLRGRVDMRSLNMIARAGVPIFSELSESMGITTEQLFAMSKKGQISSNDLVKAFQTMTSKGGMFFRGMEIASKTLTGRISTLKDNIMLLGVNLGNVLLPYAKAFVEMSLKFVGSMREMTKDTLIAKLAFESIAAAFVIATIGLVAFIAAAKGAAIITALTAAVSMLWAVLLANPLVAVTAAVLALGMAAVTAGRNWFVLSTKIEGVWETIMLASRIRQLEIKKDAEHLSLSLQKLLGHNVRFAVENALQGILGKVAWLLNKVRAVGGLAPDKALTNLNSMWERSLKKRESASAASYKRDAKKIEDTYGAAIIKQLHESKAQQDSLAARIRDAKLASGGMDTGDNTLLTADTLSKKLKTLESTEDQNKRNMRDDIDAFKSHMEDRMDLLRVAKGKEIEFLTSENARYQRLNALTDDQKIASQKATQDLITEIQEKGSKKLVENLEKEQKKTFEMLLKESSGDAKERGYLMEREAFKSHLEKRFKVMEVAADDQAQFLQTEAERINRLSVINGDQKLRGAKVINDMLLAIHAAHLESMQKLDQKASEKQAKEEARRKSEVTKQMKSFTLEAEKVKMVATKNAEMTRSAIYGITDTIVEGARTGTYAIKDMFNNLLEDIYRIMVNRAVVNFLTQLFPMSRAAAPAGGGGLTETPLSSGGGGTNPFQVSAMGNVATKPTFSLYGEKGPEAIMPLVRRNGVLGLAAPGGGGQRNAPVINIIQGPGVEVEQDRSRDAFGQDQITLMARQSTKKDFDNGIFDSNLKRRFGLKPKAMGR